MTGMTLDVKIGEVGDKLAKLLEKGVSPWQKDWELKGGSLCRNAATGKPYHGQNTILLTIQCFLSGYSTRLFVGFAQAQEIGLRMIKGSKSVPILYPKIVKKKDEETGEEQRIVIGWNWANVFNLDCFYDGSVKDAILDRFVNVDDQNSISPPQFVQHLLDVHQPKVVFDDAHSPAYVPMNDTIFMPSIHCFKSPEAYAATLIHELAHWSGHKDRMGRNLIGSKWSQEYAYEELVAEMTSAILCAEAGIAYALECHASYIAHWISLLQNDPAAFIKALKDAGKASYFLYPIVD